MSTGPMSETMQRVVDLMRSGWSLGKSCGPDGGVWLQKGGLGRGGETKSVTFSTVNALWKRGLLTFHYSFPSSEYKLKETQCPNPK